jgi:hypothetical protein
MTPDPSETKTRCPYCELAEGHLGDCVVPIIELLTNLAQILDVVKQEWGESWSAWDQEQRDKITQFLLWKV